MAALDNLIVALHTLGKASKFSPVSQLEPAIGVLTDILEGIRTTVENREAAEDLTTRTTQLVVEIADILNAASKEYLTQLRGDLDTLLKNITKLTIRAKKIRSRSRFIRFLRNETDKSLLVKLEIELKHAMEHFMVVGMASLRRDFLVKARNDQIDKLPRAGAAFDARNWSTVAECYKGTRIETLTAVQHWLDDDSPSCSPIFWLYGPPGIGKTAVSKSVASSSARDRLLGASFFFSIRVGEGCSDGRLFFSTIAYQLSQYDPRLKQVIAEALARDPDLGMKSIEDQAESLFFHPLSTLEPPLTPFTIVVDGLDECTDRDIMERLLNQMVTKLHPVSSKRVRLFLASRPESYISQILEYNSRVKTCDIQDMERGNALRDIEIYLTHNLADLAVKHHWLMPWPPKEELSKLVTRADGLFIFAATVVRFAESASWKGPEAILKAIDGDQTSNTRPLAEIDKLYQAILDNSLPAPEYDRDGFLWNVQQILTAVANEEIDDGPTVIRITFGPNPSPDVLAVLLDVPITRLFELLKNLHSVIKVPSTQSDMLKTHHKTFNEFLLDENRCSPEFLVTYSPQGRVLNILQSWFGRCNKPETGLGSKSFLSEPVQMLYYLLHQVLRRSNERCVASEQHQFWTMKIPRWVDSLHDHLGQETYDDHMWTLEALELLIYIYASSHLLSVNLLRDDLKLFWPYMLDALLGLQIDGAVLEAFTERSQSAMVLK
ncbi:hypothetical protein K474DRAFT_1673897 [Panus rudis PR-1116 ss-1]|nr:hypothetical protein K474DRAFT_1673897 [Panus rudis PR-1116 ss-1]